MTPRHQFNPSGPSRPLRIALAVAGGLLAATAVFAQDTAKDSQAPDAATTDSAVSTDTVIDVWDNASAPAPDSSVTHFVEPANIDWTILNTDPTSVYEKQAAIDRKAAAAALNDPWSWSRADKADGSSTIAIKQPISPFLDTRVGADLNLAGRTPTTSQEVLAERLAHDNRLSRSSGSAWAAMTAPGVGSIWDKTAIEARADPAQDQSKFGASLRKSLPFGGEKYSLTLQNGYSVTQQTIVPVFGLGTSSRIYDTDQSAKLGVAETGTSFIAGQRYSSGDDKWLRRVGAEQKLFGGVTVTGSVSETPDGAANRSVSAGFKRSW